MPKPTELVREFLDATTAELHPDDYDLTITAAGGAVLQRVHREHHDTVAEVHVAPDGTARAEQRLLEGDTAVLDIVLKDGGTVSAGFLR